MYGSENQDEHKNSSEVILPGVVVIDLKYIVEPLNRESVNYLETSEFVCK